MAQLYCMNISLHSSKTLIDIQYQPIWWSHINRLRNASDYCHTGLQQAVLIKLLNLIHISTMHKAWEITAIKLYRKPQPSRMNIDIKQKSDRFFKPWSIHLSYFKFFKSVVVLIKMSSINNEENTNAIYIIKTHIRWSPPLTLFKWFLIKSV